MHWLPDMVLLDLETTGGTPLEDRITEIALVRIQDGEVTDRWETLVNPGIAIPPFITQLTGISNDMVRNAPSFAEVAPQLYSYLQGMVMTAHNARFDHGFLKAEFKRLGATLRQRTLCTVKLSRKLYPQHKGHGLDAIMRRHNLRTTARHRGMGDVQLMLDYLEVAKKELGTKHVQAEIQALIQGPSLPPGLDGAFLDDMPDTPGVYLFYGENELPLYVGKSIKLRSRVLNHFSGDHTTAREMEIAQEVRRVEWINTAGELGALLLEARLIKERQPSHNRLLRKTDTVYSLRLSQRLNQLPWLKAIPSSQFEPGHFDFLYGMFRTKKAALEVVRQLADEHQLCGRLLGLETGKGSCFSHQLARCSGVCTGKETHELHHLRLKLALNNFRLKRWPYAGAIAIRETHGASGMNQLHVFEQWCHLGSVQDDSELEQLLESRSERVFDLDTYRLLSKALLKAEIIPLRRQTPAQAAHDLDWLLTTHEDAAWA